MEVMEFGILRRMEYSYWNKQYLRQHSIYWNINQVLN